MTHDDFAAELERLVADALAFHEAETDRLAKEDALREMLLRGFLSEAPRAFDVASDVSNGIITRKPTVTIGDHVSYDLQWNEPRPIRVLRFVVSLAEHNIKLLFLLDGNVLTARIVDPLEVSGDYIEELVRRLADQRSWYAGEPPEIPEPRFNANQDAA